MSLKFLTPGEISNMNSLIEMSLASKKSIHFVALHTLAAALQSSTLMHKLESNLLIRDSNFIPSIFQDQVGSSLHLRGADFFRQVILSSEAKYSHYIIGGDATSHELLWNFVKFTDSSFRIVGQFTDEISPNSSEVIETLITKIGDSGANVVWVFLGSPKQDFIADSIISRLGVATICCGAAINFVSGSLREAPAIIQHLKLEWIYRIHEDPKKHLQRYFNSIILIIVHSLLKLLK